MTEKLNLVCQHASKDRGAATAGRVANQERQRIERSPVPLHLVMDNYGTHKKEEVRGWLKKHPRFVLHFVPTSSSWLNLVERWFRELSTQCIHRGSFFSVDDLKAAIQEFLASWNEDPKPLVWTATVESIMEKLSRCRQTLEKIQPGCTLPRSKKKKP